MARGKVPSLLSTNNGGITYTEVERAGACSRCKCGLAKGIKVGLLKVATAGFSNSKRLCLGCVKEIVDKTQADLDLIKAPLI
jgi:hypothetical protein